MKKVKLLFFLTLIFTINIYGQESDYVKPIDRSVQPKQGKIPTIDLKKPTIFTLKNGLTVIVVENKKLPTFSLRISIDNPPTNEGDKSGLSQLSSALFGEGSTNVSKDVFNEEVDYLGATISMGMGFAYANGLSKHKERIIELLSDAALNPNFDQEELDKEKDKLITALKGEESSPAAIAQRVTGILTYSTDHPYGEFSTEESISKVTIKDIEGNYKQMFNPNNAYMVVSGDVEVKEIKDLVSKYFKNWKSSKKKLNSSIKSPVDVATTEINFIDMPDAVQSELAVLNITNLETKSEDHHAALVANYILGGAFNSYLNMNLREENGWTYGARSSIARNKWTSATFRATTSVRNAVTDSAVVETLKEINKIRDEFVSDEMLSTAKAKYLGNFIMSTENKSLLADFAVNIKTLNLPDDFYETFIEKINLVSKEDVKRVANKYLKPENLRIIVVGKGLDVADKLENIKYNNNLIPVKYFNKVGIQIEKPVFAKEIDASITVKNIFENHLNAIGGVEKLNNVTSISITAAVTIPGAPFKPNAIIKEKFPNKSSMEMSVPNMGTLMTQKFNGEDGYIEQMGQKIPYEDDQKTEQKEKKGLFEEIYLDDSVAQIVSLSPVDGKDIYKVQIKENSFRFYEADSGLLIMTEETTVAMGNEIKTITKFSDYKEVDGVKYAFKREIITGPQTIVIEADQVILNEEIEDDFFN
ncbi:MAG: insulinase family protein [Cryomorphaceae bacterium]|nr:MAG: insulinase family protein [Cryomorphaceae bacterium]